jgi:hypothetical protein
LPGLPSKPFQREDPGSVGRTQDAGKLDEATAPCVLNYESGRLDEALVHFPFSFTADSQKIGF